MKWRVILEPDPETNEWAIWCPELPGCISAGTTEQEALDNIREAIALYLQPDADVENICQRCRRDIANYLPNFYEFKQ
ncbi:type II toxin-antitoxin system HicB family antitoxin [Spirulina subsalsa FACHB-351]|uniref:Type II toxin-antitoxin system HicB family antitoxin n=1 Tax=Spirulina subsalsa FACHB-351 TaxID=234711 RepID=A0ABT3L7R2_9CYAN|nr:type II toxin-antitoxin system HicB family antitoxin [Spirulina subsalsa]MCW6037134.1 type II toxin-antitoxin system HicB family antitoxin [Spirulina subsalsa FACHB-351]